MNVLVRGSALLASFLTPIVAHEQHSPRTDYLMGGTVRPTATVGSANPAFYVITCKGTTADDAAIAAADATAVLGGKELLFTQSCRVAANLAIISSVAFSQGGELLPDLGATITLNGRNIDAPVNAEIFGGAGTVAAPNVTSVSVGWWGAYAASLAGTDAGPSIRAALGSNRLIVFPTSTKPYFIASSPRVSNWPPSTPGVTVMNFHNFTIDGRNAILQMRNTNTCLEHPGGNCWRAQTLAFVGNANFRVQNLTMQGWGYPTNEVASMTVHNNVDFKFDNIHCVGYGGTGSCLNAAWDVRGTFSNWFAPQAHFFTDSAFLLDVTFDKIHTRGIGGDNVSGVGGPAFSFIFDPNNVGKNTTGIDFTDTQRVTITNSDCANYSTCIFIAAGSDYTLNGNRWHDNPGHDAVRGNGVQISINPHTLVAPHGITINDTIFNNGAVTPGYGVLLSAVAYGDRTVGDISNVSIGGLIESNCNTGVGAKGLAHISRLKITASIPQSGCQTIPVEPNIKRFVMP